MSKKTWLTGGMAVLLTLGLAACGDGVDQDNGLDDGKNGDAVDQGTVEEAKGNLEEAKDNIKEAGEDINKELKENGIGDGVDQDNGVSDGTKKDEADTSSQ